MYTCLDLVANVLSRLDFSTRYTQLPETREVLRTVNNTGAATGVDALQRSHVLGVYLGFSKPDRMVRG